jgi:hypothetical protein
MDEMFSESQPTTEQASNRGTGPTTYPALAGIR